MAVYRGEVGLQFTTHLAKHYSIPQWVELAAHAQRNKFSQLWINDNLGHRNIFVLLTAIASKVPIKLGTAILVPYFRNPVDTADAFASLSELMDGREISVGIARGDYAQAGNQIHMVKPIAMVKETVECMKGLLRGDAVRYGDYPVAVGVLQPAPEFQHSIGLCSEVADFILLRRQRPANYGDRRPRDGWCSDRRLLQTARA